MTTENDRKVWMLNVAVEAPKHLSKEDVARLTQLLLDTGMTDVAMTSDVPDEGGVGATTACTLKTTVVVDELTPSIHHTPIAWDIATEKVRAALAKELLENLTCRRAFAIASEKGYSVEETLIIGIKRLVKACDILAHNLTCKMLEEKHNNEIKEKGKSEPGSNQI